MEDRKKIAELEQKIREKHPHWPTEKSNWLARMIIQAN